MLNVFFLQALAKHQQIPQNKQTRLWGIRFNNAQAEPNTLAFYKRIWFARKIFPLKNQIFLHVPSNQVTETKRKVQKWRGVPRQASLERNHGMSRIFW